ncbi:MAG TPA: hypothetical protein VFC63_19405 [Blastocatellia bacterium]|nr:hypothetical protein [Blastocatellia bacterium]
MKRRDIIFILIVIGVFGLLFYLSRTGKKPTVVKRSVPAHQTFYSDVDAGKLQWSNIPLSTCGKCHWPLPDTHPVKGKSPEEEKKGLTCTQCHAPEPQGSK